MQTVTASKATALRENRPMPLPISPHFNRVQRFLGLTVWKGRYHFCGSKDQQFCAFRKDKGAVGQSSNRTPFCSSQLSKSSKVIKSHMDAFSIKLGNPMILRISLGSSSSSISARMSSTSSSVNSDKATSAKFLRTG